MGLLSLPGELLDEIITLTLPDGFVGFALSCQTIYERATAQIDRYNKLRQLWTYAARPSNDRGKALHLLYEISRDPLVAHSIRVLRLRDAAGEGSQSDTSQLTDEFRMEEEAMDRIRSLVTHLGWLEQAGVDVEEWWAMMMREDEAVDDDEGEDEEDDGLPYTVVSLLAQLPNLETLQLPGTWRNVRPFDHADQDNTQFGYVLDALVEHSNRSTRRDQALSNLEALLPFMPAGYESRAGLQCIEPFLSLAAVRELFAVSLVAVDDQYTGIPFTWRSRLDSSLRRVELAYCCMDADGISDLLKHTPLLEVFKYSHETKWHGVQHDWNPGAFLSVLSRYCAASLTHIAITVDELYGEVINGASSFLSFIKLETLEVDVRVFCGPPLESGQRKGSASYVPEGEMPWTVHDIPCIGSMVPASIVNLLVNTDFPHADEQALRALLKNVRQQKAERLPKLAAVVVRQYDGDSAKDVFGIPGLVLCVNGNEGEAELRPRAMLPTWKRDFAVRVGGITHI